MNTCTEPIPNWMPLSYGCPRIPGHPGDHVWINRALFAQVLNMHPDNFRDWLTGDKASTHAPGDCHPSCLSYRPEES